MASDNESGATSASSSQTASTNFLVNSLMPITGHKLNGQNFNLWSKSVMIYICGKDKEDFITGKGKEDFITGKAVQPAESSPDYCGWKVDNNLIMSWLLNSMTNETGENFMYYSTAKEIWEAARDTYSNKENTFAVFEIKGILSNLKQGESFVTDYFNQLIRYWQQLDLLEDITWKCVDDNKLYKEIMERERIYTLLLGLNQELDEVRGRVLSTKPLPRIREVFAEIRREETPRKVMLGSPTTEGSALAVRGSFLAAPKGQNISNNSQRKSNKPWCDHCKKFWHTRDVCWKIHGKLENWQPSSSSRASQLSHETVATSDQEGPFNQEQMEALQKLMHDALRGRSSQKQHLRNRSSAR